MAITKKQRIAMAAIVALGVLAGGAVLLTGKHGPASGQDHGHEEAGAHGREAPGRAEGDAREQGSSVAHGREEGEHSDEHGDEAHAQEEGSGKEAGHEEDRTVKLSPQQQEIAGIATAAAGPAQLQAASEFPGEIRFNEDRTAHVVPRLAGVVEAVPANLGQQVRKGEVLAIVASTALSEQRSELLTLQRRQEAARATYEREKQLWQDKISAEQDYLQAQTALREADIALANVRQKLAAIGASPASSGLNRYEIRAPFGGTVVEKHLALGEAVKDDASIFTVSDLSSVWAEFAVAPKDLPVVRVGQQVLVSSSAFAEKVQGTISYVGSLLGEQTRTARARVTLANPQGAWRPGLFVTVSVLGAEQHAPVAVAADALQTIDDQPMVFKAVPGGFRAVPVKPGRSDGRSVEVLGGLEAGDQVATANAFVLKSELGKAGTGHDH